MRVSACAHTHVSLHVRMCECVCVPNTHEMHANNNSHDARAVDEEPRRRVPQHVTNGLQREVPHSNE